MTARTLTVPWPLDLAMTLGPLRRGVIDLTMAIDGNEVWRTTRTIDGPATMQIVARDEAVEAEAWGPGADAALELLPDLVGMHDDPSALHADHPLIRRLQRRLVGLRIGRTGAVLEALVPAILEQKVQGLDAWRSYRAIVRAFGERAPGPRPMWVAPAPEVLAAQPYHAFHPLGVERRRAEVIRAVCARATKVEEAARLPAGAARGRLMAFNGVGPWTAAEVTARAFGDPDAVSVGDFHIPHIVCGALGGEPRGSDERMLELLEPYRGQRGRVIRLLEAGLSRQPRRSPRARLRNLADI